MEKAVNLISTDHFSFKVSRQVAEIILHMDLEDVLSVTPGVMVVEFIEVRGDFLTKIVKYCEKHDFPKDILSANEEAKLQEWDRRFLRKLDTKLVPGLVKAVRLFKIDRLEQLLGKRASLLDHVDVQVFWNSESLKFAIRPYNCI